MPTTPLDGFLQSVRDQIAQGDSAAALDRLQNYLAASAPDLRDEVTLYVSRYNRNRRDERRGLISREEAAIEQTRLADAVLDFLEELPRRISREKAPAPSPVAGPEQVAIPENVRLEAILGVNNLKRIAWLERGLQLSRCVCRILTPGGLGTGFLIAADRLMTNNHVIPSQPVAEQSVAEFNYQDDFSGTSLPTCRYRLNASLFRTSTGLDYTIVGVLPDSSKPELTGYGHASLNPYADPVPGEHVVIIQHPNGGPKQVVLTANQVASSWQHLLHYTTDTMPGSSGSPVFNDLWQVIAIHHAGGDLQVNASGDKRFVNEGVLMSAIRPDGGELWPVA